MGPPPTWVLSQMFRFGPEESIWRRLFKHNMDGLKSLGEVTDQLDKLVKSDSSAMILESPTHKYKEYHCRVCLYFVPENQSLMTYILCIICIDNVSMERYQHPFHKILVYVKKISPNTIYLKWIK